MSTEIRRRLTHDWCPARPRHTRFRLGLVSLCAILACSGDGSDPSSPADPTDTPTPVLTQVSPDTLVEGTSILIRGTGFHPTASRNAVTIDGAAATVTAATATELAVAVPVFDCRPQRTVDVQVSVNGKTSNSVTAAVKPAGFTDVAVGELLLIDEPADFCLQFSPAPAGSGEYLVGVGAAAERPADLLAVTMTAVAGHPAPAIPAMSQDRGQSLAYRSAHPREPGVDDPWSGHLAAEQRIRQLERRGLARSGSGRPRHRFHDIPTGLIAAVPAVGDQLTVKVPNWNASTVEGLCTPIPINTVVRVVGQRGIFVTDVNNPTADALTDAEIQAFSDAFDSFIYDTGTGYFGTPSDLDGNGRVIVVLTIEVNKAEDGRLLGATFPLDQFDPAVCAASDLGELYYAEVPDPNNAAGTVARAKEGVVFRFTPLLAHEFTHILQISVRLRHRPTAIPPSPWELEGQAFLATEAAGHAALGLSPGHDYDAATALSAAGTPWYRAGLLALAAYYGYDFNGGRHADTPETCTLLFSDVLTPTGCEPGSGYGAAWSFFRYLADRYGPAWPGGEAGLMRDLVAAHPTLSGTANIEALLGRPFTAVFAEWAAMHYLDARVPAANPDLLMSSWGLGDIMPQLDPNATLDPVSRPFAEFRTTTSIRGGSTAYSLFTDASPRPAIAIRIRDGNDAALGTDMRPHLWVVRTR